MGFVKELADPWGLLLTACSIGVAVAIDLPTVAVALVGVAVLVGRARVTMWLRAVEERADR
ncbi:MAG: hypothetical protein M3548_13090 [Actinomycetota bacterium]|nr:hypothetical protein [Actinomycetota bacterium]